MSAEPVTVVVTRVVRAGREGAFERAVHEWVGRAAACPGYLGVHMLRPPPGGREYGAVITFDSAPAWEAFRDSAEYRAFLDGTREHLEGDPVVRTATGIETWFTPPGTPVAVAPPAWKMAVVTWLGVNLVTAVLTVTLVPLTAGWPWLLGLVTVNAAVVAGLTWLVMPLLTRLLQDWLRPAAGTDHSGKGDR